MYIGGYCIAGNFVSEKFRQKLKSGSSSGIYFRQTPVAARLLFGHAVVALLLIVFRRIHEYTTLVVCEKN